VKRPKTQPKPASRQKRVAATTLLSSSVAEIIAQHDREDRESGWTSEDFHRVHAEAFAHPETREAIKRERARLAARR
jgi:hypothetical protein